MSFPRTWITRSLPSRICRPTDSEPLERENALLAELPTLKALMTSGDDLTIQDGAAEFWQLSGTDLFVLADPAGRVVAAYAKNAPADDTLRQG